MFTSLQVSFLSLPGEGLAINDSIPLDPVVALMLI